MLGAEEGQRYYGKVYKPNEDTYITVKNPKAKNKLLKITKPNDHTDPNEINPVRDPEVKATRYIDKKG